MTTEQRQVRFKRKMALRGSFKKSVGPRDPERYAGLGPVHRELHGAQEWMEERCSELRRDRSDAAANCIAAGLQTRGKARLQKSLSSISPHEHQFKECRGSAFCAHGRQRPAPTARTAGRSAYCTQFSQVAFQAPTKIVRKRAARTFLGCLRIRTPAESFVQCE